MGTGCASATYRRAARCSGNHRKKTHARNLYRRVGLGRYRVTRACVRLEAAERSNRNGRVRCARLGFVCASSTVTKAQQVALDWLREHNGTGVFGKNGVLLAGGEWAPVTRRTWNALRDAGHVTIAGKRGRPRVTMTVKA